MYSSLVENAADEAAGVAAADNNPLRMLRSVPVVRPRVRGNKHQVCVSHQDDVFVFERNNKFIILYIIYNNII